MNRLILIAFLIFVNYDIFLQNPCPGTPTITYTGKTDYTLQIGNQCWLKGNFDVRLMT